MFSKLGQNKARCLLTELNAFVLMSTMRSLLLSKDTMTVITMKMLSTCSERMDLVNELEDDEC